MGCRSILCRAFREASAASFFPPTHLNLIKGGPAERRKSLDTVIGQVKPRYLSVLSEYQRC